MSFKFKPEDFDLLTVPVSSDAIADRANTLLEKHVAGLPRWGGIDRGSGPIVLTESVQLVDTHTARLWDIEPIKHECERHEPEIRNNGMVNLDNNYCRTCGVKLVARWEAE